MCTKMFTEDGRQGGMTKLMSVKSVPFGGENGYENICKAYSLRYVTETDMPIISC